MKCPSRRATCLVVREDGGYIRIPYIMLASSFRTVHCARNSRGRGSDSRLNNTWLLFVFGPSHLLNGDPFQDPTQAFLWDLYMHHGRLAIYFLLMNNKWHARTCLAS